MSSQPDSLGFLTVVERSTGFIGGYLILNPQARPLEFHCTAPVSPTRPQVVLYGTTLREYVCGDAIAAKLVAHAKLKPRLVFTDIPEILMARSTIKTPVIGVSPSPSKDGDDHLAAVFRRSTLVEGIEPDQLWVAAGQSADQDLVRGWWNTNGKDLNLTEPFERIRDAIEETQSSGRAVA